MIGEVFTFASNLAGVLWPGLVGATGYGLLGYFKAEGTELKNFDPVMFIETLTYGALVALVAAATGVPMDGVLGALNSISGIYLVRKLIGGIGKFIPLPLTVK